ncbi:MarR family winged helix-turn-helix transcriptional regulator [Blautia sp. Sow4_E7]|uniref:MarR family winged helix-turn-helix transcriptional regulator n=1 Tax=Blautia sp. Sow4_E7 TaxID=3438749 RepID=UPI003F8F1EB2
MTQKNLCQKLDAPKTSINSIIKRQLQTGYIELHINPQNRREKVISLTKAGKDFAEKLVNPLLEYENEAAAMMDDEELEIAIAVQNRFADILLEKVEKKHETN